MGFFGEALAKNPPPYHMKVSDFAVSFETKLFEIKGYSP
jgi:hypothetical protein